MKKKYGILAVVVLVSQLFAVGAYAAAFTYGITNGSFEDSPITNIPTSWTQTHEGNGIVTTVKTAQSFDRKTNYTANFSAPTPDNAYMAQLKATSYLSQDFSWKAGDTIKFDYAFLGFENRRFKLDIAYYSINASSTGIVQSLFSQFLPIDIELLGTTTAIDTGWQRYAYEFTKDGQGTIMFASVNVGDEAKDSFLLLDNVSLMSKTTPVPIPGSALLLGSGLLGLIGIGSRRKQM